MMMRRLAVVLAWMFVPGAAGAQSGLVGACGTLEGNLETSCYVAAQAVHSAQPQLGILIAGGNPTIGTASTGGLRLGKLPGVSATLKTNLVYLRLPALREVSVGPTDAVSYGELSVLAPSLSGSASLALFSGASLAPTIGGIGSIDLLGSASWLPLNLLDRGEFGSSSADFAWGAGVRVGVVRESFTLPGASISIMHHRLGVVEYGAICAERVATSSSSGPGYELEQGGCVFHPFNVGEYGDLGEARLDLDSWSTRAAVSKHLLGIGLSAGVGYDRYTSDMEVGVRALREGEVLPSNAYARITDVEVSDDRWSAFVNGSYSVLVTTFAAELGWMQGGEEITGYPESMSDFDPGHGSFFGSVGLRVAL